MHESIQCQLYLRYAKLAFKQVATNLNDKCAVNFCDVSDKFNIDVCERKMNSKIQIMFIYKCIYPTAALEEMTHMNGQNKS